MLVLYNVCNSKQKISLYCKDDLKKWKKKEKNYASQVNKIV